MTILAYLTLRAFGFVIAYGDVKSGKYTSQEYAPLNLDGAQDLDSLLKMAEESSANEEKRRAVVTDKCKMLLTLGSLLLGISGAYLPKYLASDSIWIRGSAACAIGLLFNVIVVLLVFFDVSTGVEISIDQSDVPLDANDLKKSLLNRHLLCVAEAGNRTNYLVNLYQAARFCFLSSLTVVASLILLGLLTSRPADETQRIVREIRSDSALIDLLRGPKGERGESGKAGPKGDTGAHGSDSDPNDIMTQLLADPRFRKDIERAVLHGIKEATKK